MTESKIPAIMRPDEMAVELDAASGMLTVAVNLATIAAAPQKIGAPIHIWLRIIQTASGTIASALEAAITGATMHVDIPHGAIKIHKS